MINKPLWVRCFKQEYLLVVSRVHIFVWGPYKYYEPLVLYTASKMTKQMGHIKFNIWTADYCDRIYRAIGVEVSPNFLKSQIMIHAVNSMEFGFSLAQKWFGLWKFIPIKVIVIL